jgi:hypothetical protein
MPAGDWGPQRAFRPRSSRPYARAPGSDRRAGRQGCYDCHSQKSASRGSLCRNATRTCRSCGGSWVWPFDYLPRLKTGHRHGNSGGFERLPPAGRPSPDAPSSRARWGARRPLRGVCGHTARSGGIRERAANQSNDGDPPGSRRRRCPPMSIVLDACLGATWSRPAGA